MDRESDLEIVSQAGSVAEGREKMAQGSIDTAIVDIPLPDDGAPDLAMVACEQGEARWTRTVKERHHEGHRPRHVRLT